MSRFFRDFPPMQNERILKVIRGEKPDKIPVWMIKQSGEYLELYRDIAMESGSDGLCRDPEIICELTLKCINRYYVDATIIYSEILSIPEALGVPLENQEEGPVIKAALTLKNIKYLQPEGAVHRLIYICDAINLTRHKLNGEVPLIGFTYAPLTLMSYMIEGGHSKLLAKTKNWLCGNRNESHEVLTLLTEIIINFLILQVEAGAQMLQVFENNCSSLNMNLFKTYSAPYLKKLKFEVNKRLLEEGLDPAPMILSTEGGHYCLQEQHDLQYDVLAIDWTISPEAARQVVGPDVILQGNLDPCALFATAKDIKNFTRKMIDDFGGYNYIANLGGELLRHAPESNVQTFISAVHDYKL